MLVVPEFYRPDDPSANGTVNDAISWIGEWLERDPRLHVSLLTPPTSADGHDPTHRLGEERRVTLIEATTPFADFDRNEPLTDTGNSADRLRARRRHVVDAATYVDAVDTLRALDFDDAGNPGMPVFERFRTARGT